ncbi:pirin family protein [Pedobacter montanisoli]|uniref:Pirin family protein n=1 Tax=Pedobacter montanisoli TaxID=2923277 RepID=A0ABS9ZTL4_9SPHI|nr:pirin family protein [Pedobacter montanisoli]MCJ0741945.1 pirin family protein [Pedobacter montanisoli]
MQANVKQVAGILNPPAPHMVGDGFRVHNFFPGGYKIKMDPFFLLDYNAKIDFSPRNTPRGVGVHPHRGFETVTIAYQGAVSHHDSAGNSGTIFPGDIQWMTAASGILHKEYHEENFTKTGGPFQMVQLWVNLPAKFKMSKPKYQTLQKDKIARYDFDDKGSYADIIAGNFKGIKGSADTFSPIEMYNLHLKNNSKIEFPLPAGYHTALLVIEGSITVNHNKKAETNQLVYFENEGELIEIEASADAVILVLSGEPINEPIAAYGPFLMNKPEEIEQAINDYNNGKFGYLEE